MGNVAPGGARKIYKRGARDANGSQKVAAKFPKSTFNSKTFFVLF